MLSKNKLKFLKSLQVKKIRDEQGLFVVEGEKSAAEVLAFKAGIIEQVFTSDPELFAGFEKHGKQVELITENELKQISGLKTPNKVLVVCRRWENEWKDFRFVLALDDIQDPGNLGTLIRLADWYGVDALVCSANTVSQYNPKVVQAAMGSIFRMPVFYTDLPAYLSESKLPVYGALLDGENVYGKTLKPEGILVLGNEGNGISGAVQKQVHTALTIPKAGETESLNVAIAGAVLLSEFCREKLR
ncbi:MAG: TrmH family RNA methyltransferase [Bacteroidota bacterium]